jgi:hypothetical protein
MILYIYIYICYMTQTAKQNVKIKVNDESITNKKIKDKQHKPTEKNPKQTTSKNMPFHTQNIPLIHRGEKHKLPINTKASNIYDRNAKYVLKPKQTFL